MARSSVRRSGPVGAAQASPGEPDHGLARPAARRPRPARWHCGVAGVRGETGRDGHHPARACPGPARPRRCARPGPAPGTGRPPSSCRSASQAAPAATATAPGQLGCAAGRPGRRRRPRRTPRSARPAARSRPGPRRGRPAPGGARARRRAAGPGRRAGLVSHRGSGRAGSRRRVRSARSRGLPGSASILRRRFFTCESTVRS